MVKAIDINENYIRFDDDTVWPDPNSETEWKLRHTEIEIPRQVLAAYLSAYRSLVWMTKESREYRIKKIRDTLKEP